MGEGITTKPSPPTRLRELTPEQAAALHRAVKLLCARIDAVLPQDARIGVDVTTEPFELLAHLRFYGTETMLYLEGLSVRSS